jgi:hypothetical protein
VIKELQHELLQVPEANTLTVSELKEQFAERVTENSKLRGQMKAATRDSQDQKRQTHAENGERRSLTSELRCELSQARDSEESDIAELQEKLSDKTSENSKLAGQVSATVRDQQK